MEWTNVILSLGIVFLCMRLCYFGCNIFCLHDPFGINLMNLNLRLPLTILLLVAHIPSALGADYTALLSKVPRHANAIVMMDVDSILSSSIAKEQGWGKKLELAYVERPIFLPPEANKMVLAASLDASKDFRRNWELAVIDLLEPMSMRSIARSEGGYVDEVRGKQIAWTPSDAYFVSLDDRTLGTVYPANRQYVSRWIQSSAEQSGVQLSEYLNKTVAMTSDQIQMLIAIDLTDLAEPHELDERVRQSELFKKANISAEVAVPILASLQGVMLRVAIKDDVQAELQINFAKDVTPLEAIAKQLVINAVGDAGVQIEEMEQWKSKVDGKSIRMMGKLSPSGQRRVFSVVEMPSAKFSLLNEEDGPSAGGSKESKMRESSLVYYRSVDALLKDLKRDLRGNKAVSAILERFATKIDRMPILNVDPALLDYGADVSETLRMVALSRRKGGIQAGVATAGMGGRGYADYSYDYGYGGSDRYAGARVSATDRTAYKAQAMAASKNARVEGAKQIAESTAAIRRAMTEKYQVEF